MWGQLSGCAGTDFLVHDLTGMRDFISMGSVHSYIPKGRLTGVTCFNSFFLTLIDRHFRRAEPSAR